MPITVHHFNLVFDPFLGTFLLLSGIWAWKFKRKKDAGILLISMAVCAFAFCLVGLLVDEFKPSRSWADKARIIEAIIGGSWLALFIVMLIFGHFKIFRWNRRKVDP